MVKVSSGDNHNNSRMAGRIFMKFVVDVMTFETNPEPCVLISYNWEKYQRGNTAPKDVSRNLGCHENRQQCSYQRLNWSCYLSFCPLKPFDGWTDGIKKVYFIYTDPCLLSRPEDRLT
jgi:hypothetical protein